MVQFQRRVRLFAAKLAEGIRNQSMPRQRDPSVLTLPWEVVCDRSAWLSAPLK